MAAFLTITSSKREFTCADILALAAQIKRRKIKPEHVVLIADKPMPKGLDNEFQLAIPIRVKIIPPALPAPTKQTMKPARRKKS
jgi:hypothetical protein